MQTLTTGDEILKDLYVGPIVESLNYKTYMLDRIERDSESVDHTGRRAIKPVHTRRNRGRGSRGDGGSLPGAGRQGWEDAIILLRRHYYAIEITDAAVEATKSKEGAFVNLLEAESKGVSRDMRKDIQRQVFGDGTGLLASVSATEAIGQTVISVDSVQYIEVGDPISILKRDDGTVAVASAEVTDRDVTSGANTITIDTALTAQATVAFGVYIFGSRNLEMDGLRNIISSGRELHGLDDTDPGLSRAWASKVSDLEGARAGEAAFELVNDQVGGVGHGDIEAWITTRGIKRRLAQNYQSQKRQVDAKAVDIHGGYTAIMVDEVPVLSDDDAPLGEAFGINKDAFTWFEQTSPGWLQSKDGQVFHLKPTEGGGGFDAVWQAYFRWYAALGCTAPNRCGRLTNCEDDDPS